MAAPTVTYVFSNGTAADAGEVNTNFNDIINALTDGTSDHSINSLTLAGAFTANGNVTIGNASGDDLTINASLASSIPVKTADTFDIGSAALGLNAVYFGDNGNSVGVKADASASADWVWSFPPAAGTKGYVPYDSDGAGDIQWAPILHDINAVSTNYTVLDGDGYRYIHVTTGASDTTITLPTAADNTDRVISVRKVDSGAGLVTLDGEGSETIDGSTTYVIGGDDAYVEVYCDGTAWYVNGSRSIFSATADNDFSSGTITVRREGRICCVKWESLAHSSASTAITSGLLPTWARPSSTQQNCYHAGTNGTQFVQISTGGTLRTRYYNTSFSADSRTGAEDGTITYIVA